MKIKSLFLTAVATLGLTVATMAQNVPSYVPTSGLVGWWPFNGNANDESGNGNNGTVNGATLTTDRFGNTNSSYSFDGNDWIEIYNKILPKNRTSFTISFWFYTNNSNGNLQSIITESSPTQNNYDYNYAGNFSTKLNWGISDYTKSGPGSGAQVNANTVVKVNTWVFGCLVNDINSNTIKVYHNGILENTVSSSWYTSMNNNTQIGRGIGGSSGIPAAYMDGKIDDIGIWSRALSQQEISALFNGCQLSVKTQPSNQTANINNNVQFVVSSSDSNATYQWQTDLGFGFQNLSNAGQYSGAQNDTLLVSNATMSNNNQNFRCIVKSGSCMDTSKIAVLTVNNKVGVNKISQTNLFSVYPNPTQNIINVKADSKLIGGVYSIYDNMGRVILTGKIHAENTTIELGSIPDGVYSFNIGGNMNQIFKVIKK